MKKKMKKKMRALLLTSILGATVFGLTGCGGTTVDLNEYISIEVSGYDTMGQANVAFDREAFEEDYGDKIKAKIDEQGGDAALMSLDLQFGREPYSVMLNYCTDYEVDKTSELSNGDTVVVTANIQGGVDSFVQQFNSIPSPVTMEYTVEGLTSYVTSSSEIDETTLNSIKQQAEDVYKANWFNLEGSMDGLQGMTYIGNYFLSKKEAMAINEANQLYMVYKVDCSYDGVSYPHYVYIKFGSLSVDEAGNVTVDLSSYELTENEWYVIDNGFFDRVYYFGYGTLDELYNDCVVSKMDVYTFENNVTE